MRSFCIQISLACMRALGGVMGRCMRVLPERMIRTMVQMGAYANCVVWLQLHPIVYPFVNEYIRRVCAGRSYVIPVRLYITPSVCMDLNLAEKTQRLIYLNRPYEAPLTRYIESTLRSGDGFIDVGAHQGYFSLLAGSRVGNSGGVLAIEALTRNAAQLQKNVSKSNLAHVVTTVRAAAGTARGNVLIHINPFNDGGATLSDLPTFSDNEEHVPKEAVYATRRPESLQELVPMARVDEQAAACSWHTKTRLVKIDVEGNELSALDSMSGLLERGIRPMIVCEVGSYTQAHSTWLTIHRYTVGKLRENGTVDLVTTPTEGAHGNFIFIPES